MAHELLKNVPLFHGLDQEDLDRLSESVEIVTISKGEELFHEGDEGNNAYVIKQGEIEIIKESNDREVLLAVQSEGRVIGEMALLESMPRTATARARSNVVLYAIQKKELDQLMNSSPSAMQSLFRTILGRLRENQVHLSQSEKMAQLGTLTAGVAHELNNPAAAVRRSADQLIDATKKLDAAYANISRLGFDDQQWQILNSLAKKAQKSAYSPPEMDALTRNDMEAEIEDWLDDHGIREAWQMAPNLVNLQFNEKELAFLAEEFPSERLMCVVEWLNATYDVYSLLHELSEGSVRISAIVKSLKSYVYLDEGPVQSVNINEGLDDTLTILHSKLKSSINVKREYAQDLPELIGHGSELNQVWTNLIDNAVDALADQEDAQVIIRTRQESGWVVVEVEDNGPGIPEDIQPKIFDAFFTTKEPGKGTGLGLNISYKIVVQKHRGDMKVSSIPGKTCFKVMLPITLTN
ncbi:MAG: cyclic nucleotide-binding domain-containing protein [Anaerolineales bacterium]|nr:cyclic nucleotide-binding domain-containing protein [Anaerolineales bacterium]